MGGSHKIQLGDQDGLFGDKVAAKVACPVGTCGAKRGERCRRAGPSLLRWEFDDREELLAPHDSRVQVYEVGECGAVQLEWCIKPKGHAGQHTYDYGQRERARAERELGGAR